MGYISEVNKLSEWQDCRLGFPDLPLARLEKYMSDGQRENW
jgi:hypothetical protein